MMTTGLRLQIPLGTVYQILACLLPFWLNLHARMSQALCTEAAD